ncbi:hypothetical protein E5Q_05803 [Mixia osmundae IAM 14324]|uniref:Uncharacterized protein n=1 Tax=Mixia osmundae (strain CBS 9802 / IAM 14324 / JCM 22182 / KY 12970) TaxID=764103 RepID=G7E8F4_MIXOS|nr:hypothetical protein E5Q_05803 [Mixia osmundae IAM 14324]
MRQWSFISFVAACTVTALAKPSWPKVDTGALAQRNSLLERGDQALADSPIEERSVLTNIYDVKMDMYGMCAETGGVIVTTIKTELHVFIQSKIADAVAVNATPMTNLTVFERHPDYVTVQLTVKGDYSKYPRISKARQ